MTDLDLTPIKARLNAATPGPWDHNTAAELIQTEKGDIVVVPTWFGEDLPRWDDAEFIANAPADIAALLAEVERLRGLLSAVVDDITAEMNLARQAYRSTQTDHFAHDYCRWVGHAEAYGNALNRIDQNKEAH